MSLLLFGSAASGGDSVPTFHSLTSGGTTTDATSYLTEIVAPTANRLVLISINCYMATGSVQPPQPTVTGNGITYALVDAQDVDTLGTDRSTMWVFRGMNSAPTAGAVTIDFGATTVGAISWNVSQSSADVDTSGTNGSGAIVQAVGATSGTTVSASPTVAFSPAMTAGNAGYFACGTQTAQAQTPRSGWVELGDVSTVAICGLETQYINAADTDGSSTWTTAARAASILVEVKSGATSPNGYIAGHASSSTGSVTALPGVTHTTPILNDIEILAHASDQAQTLAIDSDFTQLLNLVDGNLRAYLGWNVSDGTETGDVSISSTPTANRQVGALATFRGYTGIADTASLPETGTDTAHASPVYTPLHTGSLVGFVYLERTSSSTVAPVSPPGGLTKAVEFGTSGSGGTYVQIAYKDSGVVAGVDESPGDWTSLVAAGSVYVYAFELTPVTTGASGDAAATQRSSVNSTGAKQATAAVSSTGRCATSSAGRKGGVSTVPTAQRSAVRAVSAKAGQGAARTQARTSTAAVRGATIAGVGIAAQRSTTATVGSKATSAAASSAQRSTEAATGRKAATNAATSHQRSTAGTATSKAGSGTGSTSQRCSVTAAGRKGGVGTSTGPQRSAVQGVGRKSGSGSGVVPQRSASLSSLTPTSPAGAGLSVQRCSTSSAGRKGATSSSSSAVRTSTRGIGVRQAIGSASAACRVSVGGTGVRRALGAVLVQQRVTTICTEDVAYIPLADAVMTLRPNLADSTPRANPASATARPSSTAASVRPNPAEATT